MNNNPAKSKKEVICYCTGTTKAQIQALLESGMDTFEKITDQTGAGTGCGGCDYLIEELIRENGAKLTGS